MEYASILWETNNINHWILIEKVQNEVLCFVYFKINFNWLAQDDHFLENLNLRSINDRYNQLHFLCKLLNNNTDDYSFLLSQITFKIKKITISVTIISETLWHSSTVGIRKIHVLLTFPAINRFRLYFARINLITLNACSNLLRTVKKKKKDRLRCYFSSLWYHFESVWPFTRKCHCYWKLPAVANVHRRNPHVKRTYVYRATWKRCV